MDDWNKGRPLGVHELHTLLLQEGYKPAECRNLCLVA
jgi:hypothetical protein